MKFPIWLISTALVFSFFSSEQTIAQSATREPADLTSLRSRYNAEIEAAKKPVQERYVFQLQGLLKTFTLRGDLAGATAVQKELDLLKSPAANPSASRFAGTKWACTSGTSVIEFKPGGGWKDEWRGKTYGGSWKPASDNEAAAKRSDGNSWTFRMNDDSTSLTRSDGYKFNRVK
ncbi:MAG: hypothetical protein NT105_00555 [Verrucomicrobia bacterium]|nr:hypothetical protein [Verrucomicrobiota bacterium]